MTHRWPLFLVALAITFTACKRTQISGQAISPSGNIMGTTTTLDLDQSPHIVDLGNVEPRSITYREVFIHNGSSNPRTVASLESDCGCVTSSLTNTCIPTGSSASFKIAYEAPDDFGTFSKKVLVKFREQNAPPVLVYVNGFVEPWCFSIPDKIELDGVAGNRPPISKNIVLRLKPGCRIDLERPPSSPNWMTAHYVSVSHDGESRSLVNVRLSATSPDVGESSESVVFYCEDDRSYELPVKATFSPPFSTEPHSLFLGVCEHGSTVTKTIQIKPSGVTNNNPMNTVKASHDFGHQSLTMNFKPSLNQPGTFLCEFKMPEKSCFLAGNINIELGGFRAVVPVNGRVRDARD